MIRSACEASAMEPTVCAILPAGVNPISPDAMVRRAAVDHLLRVIETAAACGARRVGGPVYAPIGYATGERRTHEEWSRAIECLSALTPTLESCDVMLALEPVNRGETYFLNTAADALALTNAINHPRVGLLIDTCHAHQEEKNTARAIQSLGSRLFHLHLSENDRSLLGTGQVDFASILRVLDGIGYNGILMIEGFGYSDDPLNTLGARWAEPHVSPEDIALKGADYLRGLRAAG